MRMRSDLQACPGNLRMRACLCKWRRRPRLPGRCGVSLQGRTRVEKPRRSSEQSATRRTLEQVRSPCSTPRACMYAMAPATSWAHPSTCGRRGTPDASTGRTDIGHTQ